MKQITANHITYAEIGGAGEIVYRVVRFKAYYAEHNNEDKEVIQPFIAPSLEAKEETDYRLTGQELLYSLVNLYHEMNRPNNHVCLSTYVIYWCKNNIQPYNFKMLSVMMQGEDTVMIGDILSHEASFYIDEFIKDVCSIGMTMDYYMALEAARYGRNTKFARELYYEGRMCDTFPFFEKYHNIESDEEYIQCIKADYDYLTDTLLGLFPEHKVSLQKDSKTGHIGMYAEIDSVFDICWYTFSRLVADIAPKIDDDLDTMDSTGSYICCLACGDYVKRKGPKQKYCNDPDCQAERNRKKSNRSYKNNKGK